MAGSSTKSIPWRTRISGWLYYSAMAGLVVWGWFRQGEWNHIAEEGVGYWLGIVGGVFLLLQAAYSLRKRLGPLKLLGKTRYWFTTHMVLGVLAPVILLYHCNFSLGSLNSTVALFSMLLVAGSGLVGRYLYVRIHHGLYGRRKELDQLSKRWEVLQEEVLGEGERDEKLESLLSDFERSIQNATYNNVKAVWGLLFLRSRGRRVYLRARGRAGQGLEQVIKDKQALRAKRIDLRRVLRRRIDAACEVALFNGYERLFALWHVVHIPFFVLMLFAGIFHVIAVHMY